MVVNNLSNKVFILFEENLNGGYYSIFKLDIFGCATQEVQAQGIVEENQVVTQLDDGRYLIKVVLDNQVDFKDTFNVYYNELPNVVKEIQKVLCPCGNCREVTLDDLFKVYFRVIGFMQSTGLLCKSTAMLDATSKYYNVLTDAKEYEKYYNSFNFSYEKAIQELLVHVYIELYEMSTNQLVTSEDDLKEINQAFNIDFMEKCIYKLGYSLSDILCHFTNAKCNCDEL